MAILVGYARVSGETQRDNNSLPVQKERIAEYCIRNNHKLFTTMEDVESGEAMEDRKGLQFALQAIRANLADGLLVHKLDRLARNVLDAERLRLDLERQGKLLISIADPIDTATDSGKMVYQMLSAVAEFEKNRIKKRCEEGRSRKKLSGGYYGGRPPYGYRAEGKALVPFVKEQLVIRLARELRASGLSLSEIAFRLNVEGHRTQKGKPWTTIALCRIMGPGYSLPELDPKSL